MGNLLPIAAAAKHLGIKPSELRLSRQKGLAPGNLGRVVAGVLVWDSDDLMSPSVPASATKAELLALARARGLEVPSKTTKADLLDMLEP